jgi:hypothetical protein
MVKKNVIAWALSLAMILGTGTPAFASDWWTSGPYERIQDGYFSILDDGMNGQGVAYHGKGVQDLTMPYNIAGYNVKSHYSTLWLGDPNDEADMDSVRTIRVEDGIWDPGDLRDFSNLEAVYFTDSLREYPNLPLTVKRLNSEADGVFNIPSSAHNIERLSQGKGAGNPNITEVNFLSSDFIAIEGFDNCTNLTTVNMPNASEYIIGGASGGFANTNLKGLIAPWEWGIMYNTFANTPNFQYLVSNQHWEIGDLGGVGLYGFHRHRFGLPEGSDAIITLMPGTDREFTIDASMMDPEWVEQSPSSYWDPETETYVDTGPRVDIYVYLREDVTRDYIITDGENVIEGTLEYGGDEVIYGIPETEGPDLGGGDDGGGVDPDPEFVNKYGPEDPGVVPITVEYYMDSVSPENLLGSQTVYGPEGQEINHDEDYDLLMYAPMDEWFFIDFEGTETYEDGETAYIIYTITDEPLEVSVTLNYYKDSISPENLVGTETVVGYEGEDIWISPDVAGKFLPDGYDTIYYDGDEYYQEGGVRNLIYAKTTPEDPDKDNPNKGKDNNKGKNNGNKDPKPEVKPEPPKELLQTVISFQYKNYEYKVDETIKWLEKDNPEIKAIIKNQRTLVPARVIASEIGCDVEWEGKTKEVKIIGKSKKISFKIGSNMAIVDGAEHKLDNKVEIINGKTVLPVRFLAEQYGFVVDWDANTRQAIVLMKAE